MMCVCVCVCTGSSAVSSLFHFPSIEFIHSSVVRATLQGTLNKMKDLRKDIIFCVVRKTQYSSLSNGVAQQLFLWKGRQ
jgi:hypothetical protein